MTRRRPLAFSRKYVPPGLSRRDAARQRAALKLARKEYTRRHYVSRPRLKSFKSRPSKHVENARRIYGVDRVVPSLELARKTGCSVAALRQIVKKGEGAYYSSGSRPNQTAHSWAYARLGSAITGNNAAVVDYHIIRKGCKRTGKAYRLATRRMRL